MDTNIDTNMNKNKPKNPGQGFATASLVLSIIAFLTNWLCIFIPWMSLMALIFAIISKYQGNSSQVRTAGFVISILGILACAVFYLIVTFISK